MLYSKLDELSNYYMNADVHGYNEQMQILQHPHIILLHNDNNDD